VARYGPVPVTVGSPAPHYRRPPPVQVNLPVDDVLPLAVLADMVESYPAAVGMDGNPSGVAGHEERSGARLGCAVAQGRRSTVSAAERRV
jgi:hypothetical protein